MLKGDRGLHNWGLCGGGGPFIPEGKENHFKDVCWAAVLCYTTVVEYDTRVETSEQQRSLT